MSTPRLGRLDPDEITRLAIERRLSRRQFLAVSGAAVGAAALAGCAPPAASGGASASAAGPATGTMTLATWPNYHDPEVIKAFEGASGIKVNVTVYGSTEEMEAKIRAGNSGIDVVVPSNYAVEGWVADKLIQAIDYTKIPSFKREDWNALFMDQAFDKGNTHTIPKNWGTTGIAYRQSHVTEDVSTWKQFFEVAGTTYANKTVIVDHQISSIGSAAVGMGFSLNTIDPGEMGQIEAMLTALKPKLYAISSDVQPPLRNEDSWLTIAWTGDGVQVSRDNDDAKYIVAEDGGELWIDSFSIPTDAPNAAGAYALLDYLLQPENAALETAFCLFPHANDKATALLDPAIKDNQIIYPSQDRLAKLEYAVNATYNSPLRADTWARIKASS
ncbi:MAG: ABC transporter substrate-binding protein [Candidatus Limnocylindrales bacterium]